MPLSMQWAVPMQQKDCNCSPEDSLTCEHKLRPLAFFSRKLASSQLNWPTRQKECYAIVVSLKRWAHYLRMATIICQTDHETIQGWHREAVDTVDGPSGRQARWHELFSKFRIYVTYLKGKDNVVGDWASRWAYPAHPDVWDISIHGNRQADEQVRKMMEKEKEESTESWIKAVNQQCTTNTRQVAMVRAIQVRPVRETKSKGKEGAVIKSIFEEDWSYSYTQCPLFGHI